MPGAEDDVTDEWAGLLGKVTSPQWPFPDSGPPRMCPATADASTSRHIAGAPANDMFVSDLGWSSAESDDDNDHDNAPNGCSADDDSSDDDGEPRPAPPFPALPRPAPPRPAVVPG